MAIEDKNTFLRQFETSLTDVLTAADLAKVLSCAADILESYELTQKGTVVSENDDLLSAFTSAMRIQGRSNKTIDRYVYILKRMFHSINTTTRQVTVYHLRKYLADEKTRGVADRTLEGYRQIFSTYFNWLQREGLITVNPTSNLGAIKCQKKIRQTYSDVDIDKLKYSCRNQRDRAILCFLMSTGCRISEMTQLNRDSINFNTLEVTVLGKGNKERTVFLDEVAGLTIKQYLDVRKDNSPALFIGKGSERLSPGGVRLMLNNLAEAAHVDHVHPHKFRRTLATSLIRHGMPIQEVAAILGHDKLDTTMQYVVLDTTDVKNSYRKFA